MRRFGYSDGRDCVFKNQLLLVVSFEHYGIFIERANTSVNWSLRHQIKGDTASLLARCIKESVLNILCRRLVSIADLLSGLTLAGFLRVRKTGHDFLQHS